MRNLKKQGFLWMAVFTLCTASAVPALAAPASPEAVSAVCKVKTVNISADEAGEGGEIREITFKDGMTAVSYTHLDCTYLDDARHSGGEKAEDRPAFIFPSDYNFPGCCG